MIVTCVTIYVKPEHIDEFISACATNHRHSIEEPGNLRFDVLQCTTNASRFFLYEAYESEAAAKAHKETKHYQEWRDLVAPWMAQAREGVAHDVLFPRERSQW